MLQAFPDFTPTEPDVKDVAQLKSMGIPYWLAHPTIIEQGQTTPLTEMAGLSKNLLERCRDQGIDEFFAVQTAVVPIFLKSPSLYDSRRPPGDLCVSAPTGSGKTLAYVIPIVQILSTRVVTRLRALVVLPTRDLVSQVRETFEAVTKGTGLKIATATGHHSFAQEQAQIVDNMDDSLLGGSSKIDILIATPGRLIDHLNATPNFSLQHLRFLVIDEADRLLNQSYQDWLTHILRATQPQKLEHRLPADHLQRDSLNVPIHDAIAPSYLESHFELPVSDIDTPKMPCVQKLLFSATLTKNPAKIAGLHLTNPQYVAVRSEGQIGKDDDGSGEKYTTPDTLKEYMIVCPSDQKPMLVLHLLYNLNVKSALCFTKSVESAHRLFMLITFFERAHGKQDDGKIVAAEYSSDLTQSARRSILKKFKQGEIRLLICSDLIGRGIDLDAVDTVISYDVPLYMKKYIHRVGRTARAGREGDAYTLVEQQEARHFKEMLRKGGHLSDVKNLKVPRPNLEPFVDDYKTALTQLGSSLTTAKTSLLRYQASMHVEEEEAETKEDASEAGSTHESDNEQSDNDDVEKSDIDM
ncbi:P-loop containing nucleoside triphosphate hydrolase protein [Umbelopsis sp. AD052]|nr:P-loop containing nucleoside triphosphate hydrolase protein [Umbelopsis sp. AD052]